MTLVNHLLDLLIIQAYHSADPGYSSLPAARALLPSTMVVTSVCWPLRCWPKLATPSAPASLKQATARINAHRTILYVTERCLYLAQYRGTSMLCTDLQPG